MNIHKSFKSTLFKCILHSDPCKLTFCGLIHQPQFELCYICNRVYLFILRYGTGTLTSVFPDRVFQECLTYGGEMASKLPI